jgi:hypothetical protein
MVKLSYKFEQIKLCKDRVRTLECFSIVKFTSWVCRCFCTKNCSLSLWWRSRFDHHCNSEPKISYRSRLLARVWPFYYWEMYSYFWNEFLHPAGWAQARKVNKITEKPYCTSVNFLVSCTMTTSSFQTTVPNIDHEVNLWKWFQSV